MHFLTEKLSACVGLGGAKVGRAAICVAAEIKCLLLQQPALLWFSFKELRGVLELSAW